METQATDMTYSHWHETGPAPRPRPGVHPQPSPQVRMPASPGIRQPPSDPPRTCPISHNTVRTHLHVIYDKLHVQSRTEATVKFLNRD